jgi:release factor glutamine methyltransferase
MQRSSLKSKKVKEQEIAVREAWRSTYKNSYEEGLHFLLQGLNAEEFSTDKVLHQIRDKTPIQYILKKWFFYDGEYILDNHVLIPRPETELLVDHIIQNFSDCSTILDLGTGSGCIAIEISKKLLNSKVTGTDISKKALEIANTNNLQSSNPVNFILSNWFSEIDECFDLIVSNPPYISEKEELDESLKFEPQSALISKNEGLFDLEQIISQARHYLSEGGALLMEHGIDQESALTQKMLNNSYKKIELIKDLKGINRFILGYK